MTVPSLNGKNKIQVTHTNINVNNLYQCRHWSNEVKNMLYLNCWDIKRDDNEILPITTKKCLCSVKHPIKTQKSRSVVKQVYS